MSEKRPKALRWYDHNPITAEAMQMWRKFPRVMQRAIAVQILDWVREGKVTRSYLSDTSMQGGISLRRLFRFKGLVLQRRWYDRQPEVRSAVRQMSFLHHGDLVRVCHNILYLQRMMPESRRQWDSMTYNACRKLVKDAFAPRFLG